MECKEDCLSKLPDAVMAHILSRLPTNDAVATSVLSKAWIRKWTFIYNVQIDNANLKSSHDHTQFSEFLRSTLSNMENPRRIHLDLSDISNLSYLDSNLSNITNISDLFKALCTDWEDFVLDGKLLNTGSLISLSFHSLKWEIPNENHFPNLQSLQLGDLLIAGENSNTGTLIFTFPAVKEISLVNCCWSASKVVIDAPVLNRFVSRTSKCCDGYTMNIHCPKLEKFCSHGNLEYFILSETAVVSVTLENSDDLTDENLYLIGLRVRNLFYEFSSTLEELTLTFFLAQAILISRLGLLPRCEKLGKLVLCTGNSNIHGSTEELFEILYAAPFLKILVIKMIAWERYYYDDDDVDNLPSCIMSSLEEVEFRILSDFEMSEAVALAQFLLENGAKLKRLQYLTRGDWDLDDIMEELSSVSAASANVTISVEAPERT